MTIVNLVSVMRVTVEVRARARKREESVGGTGKQHSLVERQDAMKYLENQCQPIHSARHVLIWS